MEKQNKYEWIKIGLLAVIATLVVFQSFNKEENGTIAAKDNNKPALKNAPITPTNNIQLPPNPTPNTALPPTTTMEFGSESADLGNIKVSDGKTHTYSVKNTGGIPLTFNSIKGDPGLEIVSQPSGSIPPGESGEITVKVTEDAGTGPISKIVHIGANTQPGHMHLTVNANIAQ